jgi:hypothetical protein
LPSARPQESTCTTAGKLLVRICGSCGLSPSEPHAAEACCCRLSEAIRPNVWPSNGEPFCWSIPRVLQPHGTWWLLGRRVVFVASAHFFHRPLWVITDSESPEPREYIRNVCPPPIIDESCWGPPVFLAASLDRHFGSTEALWRYVPGPARAQKMYCSSVCTGHAGCSGILPMQRIKSRVNSRITYSPSRQDAFTCQQGKWLQGVTSWGNSSMHVLMISPQTDKRYPLS